MDGDKGLKRLYDMVKQDSFMNDVRDRNVSTVCLGFYDC